MVLNEEEKLECEVHVDGIPLHVSEFKYSGCVLKKVMMGMGRRGESGGFLASCM